MYIKCRQHSYSGCHFDAYNRLDARYNCWKIFVMASTRNLNQYSVTGIDINFDKLKWYRMGPA